MNHLTNMPCDIMDTIYNMKDTMETNDIKTADSCVCRDLKNLIKYKNKLISEHERIKDIESDISDNIDGLNQTRLVIQELVKSPFWKQIVLSALVEGLEVMQEEIEEYDSVLDDFENNLIEIYIKVVKLQKKFNDSLAHYKAVIFIKAKTSHELVYKRNKAEPKQPMAGYLAYTKSVRPGVIKTLTLALGEGMKLKGRDVVIQLAVMWKALEQKTRDQWNKDTFRLGFNAFHTANKIYAVYVFRGRDESVQYTCKYEIIWNMWNELSLKDKAIWEHSASI